jgi:competence protein ComEA
MRGEHRAERRHRAQVRLSPADASSGSEVLPASLGAARRAAWAPILLRVAAGALALVGLAAIGVAARKSPELGALVPRPPIGLAQISSPLSVSPATAETVSSAETVSVGEPPEPAPHPAPAAAPSGDSLQHQPLGAARAAKAGDRPCLERAANAVALASPRPPQSAAPPEATAPLVNLNSADARQLQRLPGVGAKRARAIIELRERLGGFRGAADLLRIRGIGRRTLERMAPHLVVGERVPPHHAALAQPAPLTSREGAERPPPRSEGH